MSLDVLRTELDRIDEGLLALLEERMDTVAKVAALKAQEGLPVLDRRREQEKLAKLQANSRPSFSGYLHGLFEMIFEQSRAYQNSLIQNHSALYSEITAALEATPKLFPPAATVACQGVEGAYSQLAAGRLFQRPSLLYFKSFETVFSAIESGFCQYGVLPLENSSAGSVTKIYDLMQKHDFKIVRSLRLKIDHSLLALPGTKLEDIREIISHEQALSQCADFLETLGKDVVITRVENTAVAAQLVQSSGRSDLAALASHSSAKLYSLETLASDMQDRSNNYTRFICISKNLEIYPGADRTSIMLVLPHKPGALYQALARVHALGINLNKLESRPLPDRDFEFMFYFDLETSVYSEEFALLLDSLHELCEEFQYLGSYIEVL